MPVTTTLHPRNHHFAWREHSGPFRLLTSKQARQFDDAGYVLLEDVVAEHALAEARSIIDAFDAESNRRLAEASEASGSIGRVDEINFDGQLAARDSRLRGFVAGSPFVDIALDLVGPDVRLYWDQSVYKRPGTAKPFPWHQDTAYAFTVPQDYLTCWVPLVDATIENGCPWVMPGEHRRGTVEHRLVESLGWVCKDEDEGGVPVEARAGDVVVFSSLTPHRTGPNLSPEMRRAYVLQYAREGTVVYQGDARDAMVVDDPERQFVVARQGVPVG